MRSFLKSSFGQLPIVLLSMFVCAGCSGSKVLVARNPQLGLARVALVLVEAPIGGRPERVASVRDAVHEALQTKGFAVVASERVASLCGVAVQDCSSAELIEQFDLDAVGKLRISTLSSNNFGVGYVALISGTLAFEADDGTVLEQVSHRETENSGILANTGQVLGAISSQAEAFSGDSFANLAAAFGRKLVLQLATPREGDAARQVPHISEVRVSDSDEFVRVCVTGSPKASVFLEGNQGARFSLTEGDAGAYCGSFRFFPAGPTTVRLNDAFGVGEQRMLSIVAQGADRCDARPEVKCERGSSAFFVSASAAGPFTKIATVAGDKVRDIETQLQGLLADANVGPKIRGVGKDAVYVVVPSPARSPVSPVVRRIQ